MWSLRHRRPCLIFPQGLLFWLSVAYSLFSVCLFWLSHFVVGTICLLCVGTYLVNFTLLGIVWVGLRQSSSSTVSALLEDLKALRRHLRTEGRLFWVVSSGGAMAALCALWVLFPRYWEADRVLGVDLQTGISADGHPWIGAADPDLTVVEFSDYQCPHCSRGHQALRAFVEAHPNRVRLEHRHYPLDHACNPALTHPFHADACSFAKEAYCAQQQGRFWEVNDALFQHTRDREPVSLPGLVAKAGLDEGTFVTCLGSREADEAIRADVAAAQALGIKATPTFILEGTIYEGRIPESILADALDGNHIVRGALDGSVDRSVAAMEGQRSGGREAALIAGGWAEREGEGKNRAQEIDRERVPVAQWGDPEGSCGPGSPARDPLNACSATDDSWRLTSN